MHRWLPLGLSLSLLACGDPHAAGRAALARGKAYTAAGRNDDARVEYELAVSKDPTLWEAKMYVARLDLDSGNFVRARTLARAVLETVPEAPYPLELLGRAELALGNDDAAIDSFTRAMDADPERVRLAFDLGRIQERLGQRDDAIASYRVALRGGAYPVEARIALAHALLPEPPHEVARQALTEASGLAGPTSRWRATIDGLLAWCDRLDAPPGASEGIAVRAPDPTIGDGSGAPPRPPVAIPSHVLVNPLGSAFLHGPLVPLRVPPIRGANGAGGAPPLGQ